jgi:O-antigen/teichoic acid export membrane protein
MSKITRNILYNGFGTVATVLLGFVAVRFVFRNLGGDALGLIYFAQTLSVTLTVGLQLGICETAVREVAAHHGKKPEYLTNIIRTEN